MSARTPKQWEFTVEGRGAFPTDMLRYDCAFPARQDDVYAMMGDRRFDVRKVTLRSTVKPPTEARWASFSWRVTETKPVVL